MRWPPNVPPTVFQVSCRRVMQPGPQSTIQPRPCLLSRTMRMMPWPRATHTPAKPTMERWRSRRSRLASSKKSSCDILGMCSAEVCGVAAQQCTTWV